MFGSMSMNAAGRPEMGVWGEDRRFVSGQVAVGI